MRKHLQPAQKYVNAQKPIHADADTFNSPKFDNAPAPCRPQRFSSFAIICLPRPKLVAALLSAWLGLGSPAHAEPQQIDLLTFIRLIEAPRGYTDYERRIPTPPPKPLTSMTIGEVIAWQKSLGKVTSTAAGGYQIIRRTLSGLVSKHQIDPDLGFTPEVQDKLALLLISECSSARTRSRDAYGNCLAHIWAALPLLSGPHAGKSAHRKVAGNKARATVAEFRAVLDGQPINVAALKAPSRTIVIPAPAARLASTSTNITVTQPQSPKLKTVTIFDVDPYQLD